MGLIFWRFSVDHSASLLKSSPWLCASQYDGVRRSCRWSPNDGCPYKKRKWQQSLAFFGWDNIPRGCKGFLLHHFNQNGQKTIIDHNTTELHFIWGNTLNDTFQLVQTQDWVFYTLHFSFTTIWSDRCSKKCWVDRSSNQLIDFAVFTTFRQTSFWEHQILSCLHIYP